MRHSTLVALTTVSFSALSIGATPAFAQVNPQPESEDCAIIADETLKQQCLERMSSVDPVAQEGEAATLPEGAEPARVEDVGARDTIVVTGSRIRRNEYTSADPIQIINPDLSEKEGRIETAEIIQSAPIAAGSFQITDAISSNFVTQGGPGAQTISLRGLGAERTLVLLNGRRAGPAGTRGQIASFDLNVLPSSIINSVEILKTGASSIYGSDAIAGVVNILTKRSTDGIELQGFVSAPFDSGGETFSTSATYGRDFGRGHFVVSANYFKREAVERRDRDFFRCTEQYIFNSEGDRVDIVDPRTGEPICNNLYSSVIQVFGAGVPGGNLQFNYPGERLGEFLPEFTGSGSFTAPPGFFATGSDTATRFGLLNLDSPVILDDSIIPQTERLTFYGEGSFEVTPNIELFTELLYNNRETIDTGSRQFFPVQFAFDPVNEGFGGPFFIRPIIPLDSDSRTEVDYYRGVLGARGGFGNMLRGWNWDIHGQYSLSDGSYTRDVIFNDAAEILTRRTAPCTPGQVTAIRGVPCVDVNLTDPRVLRGQFTREERDFLLGEDTGNTEYKQATLEGILTGSLFTLPAGDLGVALGTQYRRDEIDDVPGPATLADNLWGSTSSGITAGHTVTKELFGELEVPLLYNTPLVQRLSLNAAGRLTYVDAERNDGVEDSFNDKTYKLGVNWELNDWLRFRGSYGTSFRAPALFELFLANQTGFLGQLSIDPCIRYAERARLDQIPQRVATNCAAAGIPPDYAGTGGSSALIVTGGGIGVLEPETSTAKTISAIFTPDRGLWDGMRFSLAVDYFDIEVEGEIATLGAASILFGCYNSENFPNDPLCSLFTRNPASAPTGAFSIEEVRASYVNINRQRNRGVDVTGRVAQELGRWGTVNLLAQMTWQIEDEFQLFGESEPNDNTGEIGEPRWVGDFNATWRNNPWIVTYGLDVIGGVSDLEDFLETRERCFEDPSGIRGEICPVVESDAVFYHSLSATRLINDKFEITLGMSNIFDTAPPRFSSSFSGISVTGEVPTFGTQYDYLGRRAFINVKARM